MTEFKLGELSFRKRSRCGYRSLPQLCGAENNPLSLPSHWHLVPQPLSRPILPKKMPPRRAAYLTRSIKAGPTGLEPATSCVTGRRSNQLNYDPVQTIKKLYTAFPRLTTANTCSACANEHKKRRPSGRLFLELRSQLRSRGGIRCSVGSFQCGTIVLRRRTIIRSRFGPAVVIRVWVGAPTALASALQAGSLLPIGRLA